VLDDVFSSHVMAIAQLFLSRKFSLEARRNVRPLALWIPTSPSTRGGINLDDSAVDSP
jgi:hypothetical protein